jgi:protocatechuate 3,4-dioxygenase beta subunit
MVQPSSRRCHPSGVICTRGPRHFNPPPPNRTLEESGIRIDYVVRMTLSRRELLLGTLPAAAAIAALARRIDAQEAGVLALSPKDVCVLTCASTLGPCYYGATQIRRDITEGVVGLPTMLSFLVVDADTCQPVENAAIDIWHTNAGGVYSAPINAMCNPGDAAARTKTFTRGVQLTDAAGWAHFNSVYPGWYSGRTPHIHATIRRGTTAIVTTQFFFDDALSDWVYHNHPIYTSRPNRDTTNLTDNVIGGSAARATPFIFQSKLINQKSLVALKVIAIRNSATRCSA